MTLDPVQLRKSGDTLDSLITDALRRRHPDDVALKKARSILDRMGFKEKSLSDVFVQAAESGDINGLRSAIVVYREAVTNAAVQIKDLQQEVTTLEAKLADNEANGVNNPELLRKLAEVQESARAHQSAHQEMLETWKDGLKERSALKRDYQQVSEQNNRLRTENAALKNENAAFTQREKEHLTEINRLNYLKSELDDRFDEYAVLLQNLSTANSRYFAHTIMQLQRSLGAARSLARKHSAANTLLSELQSMLSDFNDTYHKLQVGIHTTPDHVPNTHDTVASVGLLSHTLNGEKSLFDGSFHSTSATEAFHEATKLQMELVAYMLSKRCDDIRVGTLSNDAISIYAPENNPKMFGDKDQCDDRLFLLTLYNEKSKQRQTFAVCSSHDTCDNTFGLYFLVAPKYLEPGNLRLSGNNHLGKRLQYEDGHVAKMHKADWHRIAYTMMYLAQKNTFDRDSINETDDLIGGLAITCDKTFLATEKKPLLSHGNALLSVIANNNDQASKPGCLVPTIR